MSDARPPSAIRRVGPRVTPRLPSPRRRVGVGHWTAFGLAIVTLIVAATLSAAQATQRETAEAVLARIAQSLFEIDEVVVYSWDDLNAAAAAGAPLTLAAYPLDLQLQPVDLAGGRLALADLIAQRSARLLYDGGFDLLRIEPRGPTDFFSRASAFSGTVGRLTSGGRTLAAIALIVSLCAFFPLALGSLAQARGSMRLAQPGIAIGVGGLLAFVFGAVVASRFEGLASAATDPLLVELYAIAADLMTLLMRNGGIIAILGAALLALAVLGAELERRV